MSSAITVSGIICLGIVVGVLVWFFITKFEHFNTKALGSVLSLLGGGSVGALLQNRNPVLWWYPIGLLLGIILFYFGKIFWQEIMRDAPVPRRCVNCGKNPVTGE